MDAQPYNISFRCYFGTGDDLDSRHSSHYQRMPLEDIPWWIEAYHFTHPNLKSIVMKVWFQDNGIEFQS